MKTSLHRVEVILYIGAWAAGIYASLYHYYIGQEELINNGTIPISQLHGLKEGWTWIPRPQDNSDGEWSSWKYYLHEFSVPIIFHFIVSECLRNCRYSLIPYWHIIFTTIFATVYFGITQMLLMIAQPIVYFLALYTVKKKLWIWLMSVMILLGMNYLKKEVLFWHFLDQKMEDVFLVLTSLSWIQLRCITFCFDQIDKENGMKITRNEQIQGRKLKEEKLKQETKSTLIIMLSYILYFPTFLMGPLILYSDFEKSLIKENARSLMTRLKRGFIDLGILLFYMFLFELILHYIYFTAMKYNPQNVNMLRNSGFCGAGLFMGLHFYVKYVIMYGICGALAGLDGVRPPPTPRCIMRIHLYSHMWKYFDVGLYRFLVKYMYKPTLSWISGDKSATSITRLLAASLTFTFIFAWHGTSYSILVWSLLNFVGISTESFCRFIGTTRSYASFKNIILRTDQNEDRFLAVISTPSLMMSFLANIYYFAGEEIGQFFLVRYFTERWYNMLLVYFCLHACCHGSKALAEVSSRTDRDDKDKVRKE